MKKMLKILFILSIVICILILVKVIIKMSTNNAFITDYPEKEQEYRLKKNMFINLYEPYVVYYNYGNYLYKKGQYEEAYEKYLQALEYDMPNIASCEVNMNIALTLYKQTDGMNDYNKAKTLTEAQSYLQKCNNLTKDKHIKLSTIILIMVIVIGFFLIILAIIMDRKMGFLPDISIYCINELDNLRKGLLNGNIHNDDASRKICTTIKEYVQKNLKINILNLSQIEINKLGIHDLDLLMEEYYINEHSKDDNNVIESIDRTMEVIRKWSWK